MNRNGHGSSLLETDAPRSAPAHLPVTVIVPVFRGGEILPACLASVAAALRPGDEFLVVADGEGDGAWRRAPEHGARVLPLPHNGGPGPARNHGARHATGEILFFVDADVTVPPHALALIEAVFRREPELAALFGSYDETPAQPNFLSQFKNLLHHYVHQGGSAEASTFWAGCGAIRREVFVAVGGFADRYTSASIEDIELGYRLTTGGHPIRLVKELQVTHHKRWTPWSLVKTDVFLRAKPWTRLLWRQVWRNGRVRTSLNLDSSHQWSLVVSAALLAAAGAALVRPAAWPAVLALAGLFLWVNRRVLRFFHAKRGWRFAAAAALWRFGFDLYSWVGFGCGSSDSARLALRRLTLFTFSEIDGVALGVAVGAVTGAGLFLATAWLLVKGGPGPNLRLLGQFLPGYGLSWGGAAVGLGEGVVLGYALGWSFALIRNFSVRLAMGAERVNRAAGRLFRAAAAPADR